MELIATMRRIRACEGEAAAQLVLESLIAQHAAAERARCIATLVALKDASGVNDDGHAWLMRLTRGNCVAALEALRPNVEANRPDTAR